MFRALSLFTLVPVVTFLIGCGGGSHGNSEASALGRGTIKVAVKWPRAAASREIPPEAQSIMVQLVRNGEVIRSSKIVRPGNETAFEEVVSGSAVLRARALLGADGAGDVLASAERQITVLPNGHTTEALDLQRVLPPVTNGQYLIGGSISTDPGDPRTVIIALNALFDRVNGKPLTGLTKDNFVVYEDDINRGVVSAQETGSGKTTSRADIAFLIDTTGSMDTEIEGVRQSVTAFANFIASKGVDVRLAGVPFKDDVGDPVEFTSDYSSFKNWVAGLTAEGGDDNPENDLDAVMTALNSLHWREGAQRLIVVITDAPMHYKGDSEGFAHYTVQEVADALISRATVLHSVSPEGSVSRRAGVRRSASNSPGAPSKRPTRDAEYPDIAQVARATGGADIAISPDGAVDLTSLKLSEIVLSGYIVKFQSVPTNQDHTIRLIVKLDSIPVADKEFKGHY